MNIKPDRLAEVLCLRDKRYVTRDLTQKYDGKRIRVEVNGLTRGLVGKSVDVYEFVLGIWDNGAAFCAGPNGGWLATVFPILMWMTALVVAMLALERLMLREVHHRIKNNLQLITSILNMQIRGLSAPRLIEGFAVQLDAEMETRPTADSYTLSISFQPLDIDAGAPDGDSLAFYGAAPAARRAEG